ncbi:MAG: IclR family transcriptional regulator [Syntrophorhabdaceae bacterium]|nr:IclR family transcriptional regulator [Syntrophorhabdaceae bacterium]
MEQIGNIKVIEKVISILDLYTFKENSFSFAEIKKKTGLPKTTLFRILKSLEKAGLLRYDEIQNKYSLGLRLFELGGIVYSSLSIRKAAARYMDALSSSLKATILLGVIKDDHLLYIDKREGDSIIRVTSHSGLKRPPYYGMLGMTLVAYMDDEERRRLFKLFPPTKITEKTVTDIEEILKRLDETRRCGYYIEVDEIIEGLTGIGVPIVDFSGKVVAAIGATQPGFQIKEGSVVKIIDELKEAAQAISKELGYNSRNGPQNKNFY